ncbi:MAG: flagellar filament capping protein FliD [Syntrophobacterales bacterium]|nr:flagellar filament capping protein FliD [Syntrophobacterales bacterium]
MATSTSLITGLTSGLDWNSIVTQLIAIDHKRVDLVSQKKTETENKLKEWQSFNTKLLALKTAAKNLVSAEGFSLFKATTTTNSSTVKASDLLSVTTSQDASPGSYSVKINSIATAEKISSAPFSSATTALGTAYAGDILINQVRVSINDTDTLTTVRDKINNANSGANPSGVTASIVKYGEGDYRLILTGTATGKAGFSILNGGAVDVLNRLGFTDASRSAKNHLAGADLSDRFTSINEPIMTLLGLTTAQTSANNEIVINGNDVAAIDLSTDTLSTLQGKLSAAGLSASITTETEGGKTYYRLMIEGSANTYTDKNNILETLGFLQGGVSDVYGVTGDVANTSGGAFITADTLIKDIDGYTGYASSDRIHLEGTNTNGIPVSDDTLILSDTTTVGDLLAKVESVFGNVTATVTGTGKLMVVDNNPGTSLLSVKVSVKNSDNTPDLTLRFDTDDDLGSAATVRQRQVAAGADASLDINGVTVTSSSNTIDDVLPGVTLDLLKADPTTTITLNVARDTDAVIEKIKAFVNSYNSVASYIQAQSSYDTDKQQTGGVLFGDGTLASVKSTLSSILVEGIWGVSPQFSILGQIGVNLDNEGKLSVDEGTLRGYLTTNFDDVKRLFIADAETNVGTLSYISHTSATKQGEYTVHITTAATRTATEPSDSTSLTGDEELTITEGEKTAVVALTAGMTMAQVVNAINSELQSSGISVTAATDSGGHLVLTHNAYGSGHDFQVTQKNDKLWTDGVVAVTAGVDVTGTINGEEATGVGQVLTGRSGQPNVDGLVIKYTGTAPGVDVGTVKLTFGVAELYDRALFNMTDSIDGYLTFKQKSMQESIKNYQTQIDEMEARLELKREQLLNNYARMEAALLKIQNQGNWLSGQLTAALSGWGSI